MVHRAKLWPAHGTERGFLEAVLRKGFVVIGTGRVRIKRQIELAVPIEGKAGAGKLIVTIARASAVPGDIGGVGGDFVSDDAGLDVVAVGQPQMLLGSDVAEHGCSVPANHGRADG